MAEFTIDQALQQGVEAHKAGQVQEADRLYTAILKAQPKHPDANHNMGVLAVGVGKVEQSLPFFKTALEANPSTAQFWISYIDALIKLQRLPEAKAVLDQAKSKGAKVDGFDPLEKRLKEFRQGQTTASNTGPEEYGDQQNILDALKLDQALRVAKKNVKEGSPEEAKRIYQDILGKFPKNKRAIGGLKELAGRAVGKVSKVQDPPQNQLQTLTNLYSQGKFQQALEQATTLLQQFPNSSVLHNICGAVYQELGQLDTSVEAYNKALAIKPDYAEAYNNLGVALQEQDKLEEAVKSFNKALAIKPAYAEPYNNIGNALQEQDRLDEAIVAYKKAVAINPVYAEAHNNLGVALQKKDKLEEAVKSFNKALAIKPAYAEPYNNIGNALQEQDRLDEAIVAYKKAVAINPAYAKAYYNMGVALKEQDREEEAIEAYKKALAIKPDYADAYNNLGIALKEQDKVEEAITVYRKALAIKPDYADAYNNLGVALQDQDKLEEAVEAFNKAVAIKPDYADAWSNGAEAFEKRNKLERLELWLEKAFQAFEKVPSDIRLMKSKLLWRNKNEEEASKLISDIDFETITDIRKQDCLNLKAKCFEITKDFDKAYDCFSKSNSLAKKSNDYLKHKPEIYFQDLRETLTKLKSIPLQTPKFHSRAEAGFTPVFLVGFPRSGTTLLDTILRSHSKIEVVEEQLAVNSAQIFLQQSGYHDLANQMIPLALAAEAKKVYEVEFNKHIEGVKSGSVFIDKLPLNLLHVPLIQQLYPQAKFILALRHPLDTILSCWMQNFKLNAAMANMVDLDRIVEFYCIAMETFKICQDEYNLSVHKIRYEDLLEDLSGETSSLLKFLDLEWEPQMENYRDTALKRGRINTPSYSQVVQPIYKDAKYRWLNYEKYLSKYIVQAGPWIDQFGYGKH